MQIICCLHKKSNLAYHKIFKKKMPKHFKVGFHNYFYLVKYNLCRAPDSCPPFFLLAAVAMEDVMRLVSSGDCLKIWDSTSMTVVEQFNPHSATHPVAQVCWSSSSILSHEITHMSHSNASMHHTWSCLFVASVRTDIPCLLKFHLTELTGLPLVGPRLFKWVWGKVKKNNVKMWINK